jgi:hypothetical protein
MIGISFDDYADTVARHRADTLVAHAGNWNAIDREPGRAYADDLSSMRGGVIKSDHVGHCYALFDGWMVSSFAIDVGMFAELGVSYRTRRQTVLALC